MIQVGALPQQSPARRGDVVPPSAPAAARGQAEHSASRTHSPHLTASERAAYCGAPSANVAGTHAYEMSPTYISR